MCDRQRASGAAYTRFLMLFLTGAALVASPSQANTSATFSEQLLQSYFDTAGVCTTSSVQAINESANRVSVHINIEPATAKALTDVEDSLRDDWFSLHCPPEIHGVWRQPNPPADVLISGKINEEIQHTLSCRSYLHLGEQQQPVTFKQKILHTVERLLGR